MTKQYIFLGLLLVFALFSCEDAGLEPETVVRLNGAPNITAPSSGTTFTLDESEQENAITSFEWTAADFGFQAAVTYSIEIDQKGSDFANAISLGSTNTTSITDITIGKVNSILLATGLPFGFDNEMEIRVCATISSQVETLCSDVVNININPYAAEIVYPTLTVPGDYQGWDPGDEDYSIFSRKSDDIYEGYIYFSVENAVYKFAQGGTWDTNWGDVGMDGILDAGGIDNNISIEEGSGMYMINCDLNTLTHSNQKTDWGVIGDATPTGWDADTDMIWDEDRGVLSLNLDLQAGELKFRANDDWEINFGDDFTNGTLEADGENIPITEAGNYTIDLILNVADYTYSITKN